MITTRRDPPEKVKAPIKSKVRYWKLTQAERDERRRLKYQKHGEQLRWWHRQMIIPCGGPVDFMTKAEIEQRALMTAKERQKDRAFY